MTLVEVINLIALVVGPLFAVIVGQKLQIRKEVREDKMKIFRTLMVSRAYPWTQNMVDALNMIDIVFVDDIPVRNAWKDLFDKYSVVNADEAHIIKVKNAQYRLLESMANSLGYKNKIDWETIQNPYLPRGLQNQLDLQMQNQEVSNYILNSMKESFTNTM